MITHKIIKTTTDLDIVIEYVNGEIIMEKIPSLMKGTPTHWHRSIEFTYIRKGEINFLANGRYRKLHAGDFIFVNSAEVHRLFSPNVQELEIIMILFPYSTIHHFLPNIDSVTFDIYKDGSYDPLFYDFFDFLYGYILFPKPYDRLKMNSYLFDLLYVLETKYQSTDENIMHFKKMQHDILDYIENNYQEDLTLQKLSQEFKLSPEYLSRQFKKLFGINFKTYLTEYRLNSSLNDIVYSNLNMQEIALKHGFSSVKVFINGFKNNFHQTPYQYRITHNKKL